MKSLKRLFSVLIILSTFVSLLALSSCGEERGNISQSTHSSKNEASGGEKTGVEKVIEMQNKLANATSYTLESVDKEGNTTITMVDFNNFMLFELEKDQSGDVEEEMYCWHDKDADKYYFSSESYGTSIYKIEASEEELLDELMGYKEPSREDDFREGLETGLYVEEDGAIAYERKVGSKTYKQVMSVQDEAILLTYTETVNGVTATYTYKYYNINETSVVVPDKYLNAECD